MSDSLVRVSRRVGPLQLQPRSWHAQTRRCRERRSLDPGPAGQLPNPKKWRACWRGLNRSCYRGPRTKRGPEHQSGTLASNDFTYYFTFFSKFFSSFPHGTCSLSVSRKYLALDGHYHPVSAAVPSNTTHRKGSWWGRPHGTGL